MADIDLTNINLESVTEVKSSYGDVANALENLLGSLQSGGAGSYVSGKLGGNIGNGDDQAVGLYYSGSANSGNLVYVDSSGTEHNLTLASQAMNNTKLSRTGDTTTGNIIFNSGNSVSSWAASPQSLYEIGGALMSTWSQIDGNGNIQLLLGGNNADEPYLKPWAFNPTNRAVFTPAGNNLLEVGDISAPRVRQSFRVSITGETRISWPKAFSSDSNVYAHFTPVTPDFSTCIAINYMALLPNALGVNVNPYVNGTLATTPIMVDVTVEGYA